MEIGLTLGCRGKSLCWTVPGQTRVGWLIVLPLVAEISLSETNICIFSRQLAFGRITVIEPEENKLLTIFSFPTSAWISYTTKGFLSFKWSIYLGNSSSLFDFA